MSLDLMTLDIQVNISTVQLEGDQAKMDQREKITAVTLVIS